MVWIESPTNPTLIIVDIERVVKIVKESSPEAIIVVDNTFMTPMAQASRIISNPLQFHFLF